MKKKGVLIIHGFVGNPNEVSFLSERLEKQGYFVSVPLLPGHGQGNKPLQKVKVTEWIIAVEKAYLELKKSCDYVFVVGFSMGGLLAAHLWNYKITGLVTVNTPVYYWNLKQIIFNLTSDYTKYSLKYLNSGKGKPLNAMAQFQKLLFSTIPVFKRLNCNTLVLQAADDDTVVPKSSDFIFSRITGEKHLIKLAKGGHQIFQSERAQEASLIIERYFENLS